MKKIILFSFIFFVVGVNVGIENSQYSHVWPKERGGMYQLDQLAKDDKSDRLAMVLITQKQQYQISAMNEFYSIVAYVVKHDKPTW